MSLNASQRAELAMLKVMPNSQINTKQITVTVLDCTP